MVSLVLEVFMNALGALSVVRQRCVGCVVWEVWWCPGGAGSGGPGRQLSGSVILVAALIRGARSGWLGSVCDFGHICSRCAVDGC